MTLGELLYNLVFDYTLRTVALGSAVLGIVSGALGAFALLRRQSLLGDAISHAALPGVVLAFLLTRSKDPLVLIVGAMITGWLATAWMTGIVRNTRIKEDGALGLSLSVFFGFGLMLLTLAQRLPDARQSGLDHYLFGQAAAMLQGDVITMVVLGGAALALMGVFWKEFKLLSFDREYAASLGFPVRILDGLLFTLLVVAIVIGLQTVGVVLMSAMVVAPAAASRQWTDRLEVMVLLSSLFGALAGVSGAVISSTTEHLSTGPTIVLCISLIFSISLLLAPNRGLIWQWGRQQINRRRLRLETVLFDMYTLASQHADLHHAHTAEVLQTMNDRSGGVRHSLQRLAEQGLVVREGEAQWALTQKGILTAENLRKGIGSSPGGGQ